MAPENSPTVKKRRVNSKGKGSGFENSIAKRLSEVLAPLQFRRSQSSGAILGGKNDKLLEKFSSSAKALFVGDVVPTNEADAFEFKFTVECKFYRDAENFKKLFGENRIWGWYDEAKVDAAKVSKQPLLVFKFNHTDVYCALSVSYPLPSTVTSLLTLHRNIETGRADIGTYVKSERLNLFLFDEALRDVNWWKRNPTR